MAQFVFLYRRSGGIPTGSPAQMQERMQKWQAWFKQLADSGHLKDRGLPLDKVGNVVGGTSKKNVTDGPYAEKDLVMGFSLIEARDLAHATELALTHPLADEGNYVEVRPVLSM
jgi:hypothetical protein